MALPQGIAFRGSSGYVTDGANDYGEISTTANYPTTSTQGNSVGWETNGPTAALDRNNTIDARLAGLAYCTSSRTYRVDIPSTGDYNVRCAVGDGASTSDADVQLKDNATAFVTLSASGQSTNTFMDAGGTNRSAATWPANNVAVTRTFGSTIFRATCNNDSLGASDVLAYIYIEVSAGGGGGATTAGILLVPGNMRGNLGNLSGRFM